MADVTALSVVALVMTTPTAAWAAKPVPPVPVPAPLTDITATARGMTLAQEAAERFASYGVPTDSTDLRVLKNSDGSVIVAPSVLTPTLEGQLGSSGEAGAFVEVGADLGAAGESNERDSRMDSPAIAPMASAYWSLQEQGCLASLPVDSARLDSCYYIYKLVNDGSSTRSYWALRQKGTAFEYGGGLRSAWLSGERTANTAAQTWVDWGPEQGHTGSCSTVSAGVSYIATLSYSVQACEKWSINKSCNTCSPYFKTTWDCNCWFGLETKTSTPISRAVAYQMLVSLSNSATPRFRLGLGMAA